MPWAVFGIALLGVLLLQTTLLAALGLNDDLDLFLVLTILCGLLAPTLDARIAGWLIGLCQDLSSGAGLGPRALALGLTAWLITLLRDWIPVRPLLTRLIVAFVAALPGQMLALAHSFWWRGHGTATFGRLLVLALLSSLLAAVLAVALTCLPWLAQRRRTQFRSARPY